MKHMLIQHYKYNLRFIIVAIIYVLLLATYSNLDTPTSKFNRFNSGVISGIALVVLCPVVLRGRVWQKMLGMVLAILPGIMLFRAVDYLWAIHDR